MTCNPLVTLDRTFLSPGSKLPLDFGDKERSSMAINEDQKAESKGDSKSKHIESRESSIVHFLVIVESPDCCRVCWEMLPILLNDRCYWSSIANG